MAMSIRRRDIDWGIPGKCQDSHDLSRDILKGFEFDLKHATAYNLHP